jgi:hypothetical protein
MALYNNVSGDDIKRTPNGLANDLERIMAKLDDWSSEMLTIPSADMSALGVSEDWQAQIGSMRSEVAALVACWDDPAHSTFTRRFRQLQVF